MIYEDKAKPEQFYQVETTEDERYATLSWGQGREGECAVFSRAFETGEVIYRDRAEISDDSFQVVIM